MAKGQQRTPKEKKKPKADPNKTKTLSAYKQGYVSPSSTSSLGAKKS